MPNSTTRTGPDRTRPDQTKSADSRESRADPTDFGYLHTIVSAENTKITATTNNTTSRHCGALTPIGVRWVLVVEFGHGPDPTRPDPTVSAVAELLVALPAHDDNNNDDNDDDDDWVSRISLPVRVQ